MALSSWDQSTPFSLYHSSQNSDWCKNRRLGNPAADGSFSLMNDACRPRVIRSGNDKSAMTKSSWSNQPVLRQIEYWTAFKSLNRDCSSKRVIDKWSSSYIDLSSSNASLIYLAPYTFTLKRKNCVEKTKILQNYYFFVLSARFSSQPLVYVAVNPAQWLPNQSFGNLASTHRQPLL